MIVATDTVASLNISVCFFYHRFSMCADTHIHMNTLAAAATLFTRKSMHIPVEETFQRNPFSFHFHGKLLYLLIILYVNHATLRLHIAATDIMSTLCLLVRSFARLHSLFFHIGCTHNDKNRCETFRINQKESTYFTVENFVFAPALFLSLESRKPEIAINLCFTLPK